MVADFLLLLVGDSIIPTGLARTGHEVIAALRHGSPLWSFSVCSAQRHFRKKTDISGRFKPNRRHFRNITFPILQLCAWKWWLIRMPSVHGEALHAVTKSSRSSHAALDDQLNLGGQSGTATQIYADLIIKILNLQNFSLVK